MRLIDADALCKHLHELKTGDKDTVYEYYDDGIDTAISTVAVFPTIEAEPVKHGRWITDNNKQTKCSICGRPIPLRKVRHNGEVIWEDNSPVNYCPRCGAKMDLEEGDYHE